MTTPRQILQRPYARVIFPEPDGSFRAEILEFPGCIATGDSPAEALATLEEVAECWLEAVLANQQEVPEPTEEQRLSGKLVLRLSKSIHARAARAAKRDGVSLNHFISNAVAVAVGASDAIGATQAAANFAVARLFDKVQAKVNRDQYIVFQSSAAHEAAAIHRWYFGDTTKTVILGASGVSEKQDFFTTVQPHADELIFEGRTKVVPAKKRVFSHV